MKKLFILIFAVLLSLCACKEKEKIDLTNEEIEYVSIYYQADDDGKVYCGVIVDFREDDILLKRKDYTNEIEKYFKVFDSEKIKSFVKESLVKEYGDEKNNYGKSNDQKRDLWSISVRTDKDGYNFSDYYKYPTYWDELWEILIETTEAENLSDFGFTEELTSTEK